MQVIEAGLSEGIGVITAAAHSSIDRFPTMPSAQVSKKQLCLFRKRIRGRGVRLRLLSFYPLDGLYLSVLKFDFVLAPPRFHFKRKQSCQCGPSSLCSFFVSVRLRCRRITSLDRPASAQASYLLPTALIQYQVPSPALQTV